MRTSGKNFRPADFAVGVPEFNLEHVPVGAVYDGARSLNLCAVRGFENLQNNGGLDLNKLPS